MLRLLCSFFIVSLLCVSPAHAQDEAQAPATPAGNDLYLGVGLFSDMMNINLEKVTRWGNFMGRIGEFRDVEGLAVNLSWRKPLEGEDGNATGFYLGLFGGHVAGENIGGEAYQRLGAGAEMGYHWVKEYTRAELTVGLGAAEPLDEAGVEYAAEPTLFISFSMALGY